MSRFLPHPHGVKPKGNELYESSNSDYIDIRISSLGDFNMLPDEILYDILFFCDAKTLSQLMQVNKTFFCWTRLDEYWKHFVIKETSRDLGIQWFGNSWRECYIGMKQGKPLKKMANIIQIRNLYSDVLFQAWINVNSKISHTWISKQNIEIINFDKENPIFKSNYSSLNKPVLIKNLVSSWSIDSLNSLDSLVQNYGNIKFKAEAMDCTLNNYVQYMNNCLDEAPFYLFDSDFYESMKIENDFNVKDYFDDDLFSLLGKDRPDYRW